MNAVVTTRREGAIAVVAIDNPPVNALSTPVKRALLAAFAALERDPAVKGVVLSAAGHTFAAGADIGEMDRAPEPPFLPEVVAAIDACTKPTAAALFGNVLGGGLELALACRLRVADAATRLGFPEVKLGLAPGAGGTQRLMRRTDFATAVRLVTTGKSIGAEEASGL
ncbi:MAG: enoyl-CoA hydratase/isomerase family protein, partial [Roseiarcus sp.]